MYYSMIFNIEAKGIPWPKTVATDYHAQLGQRVIQSKGWLYYGPLDAKSYTTLARFGSDIHQKRPPLEVYATLI